MKSYSLLNIYSWLGRASLPRYPPGTGNMGLRPPSKVRPAERDRPAWI